MLRLIIGVTMALAGLVFLIASYSDDPDAAILSMVMITIGGFQVVSWFTRDRSASGKASFLETLAAERFGAGMIAVGGGLLLFDRSSLWRVAMAAVLLIAGGGIVYLARRLS